jgi:Secretion system C-terminal sorting domain
MKKKATFWLLLIAISINSSFAQRIDTVTVGRNQFAISGNTYSFFQTVEFQPLFWNRSVYIYPRQALKGMPQNAEMTAFRMFRDVTRVSGVTPVQGKFPANAVVTAKIWMANTNLEEWGDTLKKWSLVQNTLTPTLVFDGDLKQYIDSTSGWKTFPLLNTPFRYDSTKNLAIMVEYYQDMATVGQIFWAYDSTMVKVGATDTTNYFSRYQLRFCHKLFSGTVAPVDSFTGSNIRHPHIKFLYKAKPNLIFEHDANDAFKIYPNPVATVLTVDLNGDFKPNVQFYMVDILGKTYFQKEIVILNEPHQEQIDVSHLPAGTYFLIANDGKMRRVRSFFKLK